MGEVLVALPKYPRVPKDTFILEFWKPPSFYLEHGRENLEIKWSHLGACRCLPPLPARGDYEAVECGFDFPMRFFNRYTKLTLPTGEEWEAAPMTPELIEMAIRHHQIARETSSADRLGTLKRTWEIEERKDDTLYDDVISEAMGPFGFRIHSGYGPKTKDLPT